MRATPEERRGIGDQYMFDNSFPQLQSFALSINYDCYWYFGI